MVAWALLIISGVIEAFWPIALKASDGFTKLWPSIVSITIIALSMYCFTLAVRSIPPATAYIVFVGMGAVGVSITGAIFYNEAFSLLKLLCIFMIIAGIVGLNLVSNR